MYNYNNLNFRLFFSSVPGLPSLLRWVQRCAKTGDPGGGLVLAPPPAQPLRQDGGLETGGRDGWDRSPRWSRRGRRQGSAQPESEVFQTDLWSQVKNALRQV